jgi:oligoribonuclease NrnB/cAMP/cGMP phosphodiesterase (DHH superfamily)
MDFMQTTPLNDIVVIYHKNCYDGFAAAWAVWKKFGNSASYLPYLYRDAYPAGVENKEVYVLDFCFSETVTKELQTKNKKFVILDHHISVRELVNSSLENVFSDTDSGAKIAWKYFHPDKEVPQLIEYISDSDTWAHKLSNYKEIEGYIHIHELEFSVFDMLCEELEERPESVLEKGKVLNKQFNNLVTEHVEKAMLVEFEGYEVYAVNASSFLRSELGHRLAMKKGPFAIVYRFEKDVLRISLRGDGSIDCSKLVEKYGGGGHYGAAAIIMKNKNPLPFRMIEKN